MKLYELFNTLNEKLLHSDFSMGFELEAYYDGDHSNLNQIFSKYLPTDGGDFQEDPTLWDIRGDKKGSFEWASPVYNVNIGLIKKVMNFLQNLEGESIYTTEKCGLHFHLSFPNMNTQDMIWVTLNLAMDKNMFEKLTKFKKYNFFNKVQADKEYLENIREYILTDNWDAIKTYIAPQKYDIQSIRDGVSGKSKYRILRMHPQGTLEWRGPRNFLNKPNRLEIKQFLILLWEFISWISNVMQKQELHGKSKSKIMDLFKVDNEDINLIEKSMEKLLKTLQNCNDKNLTQRLSKIKNKRIIEYLKTHDTTLYGKANFKPENQVELVNIDPELLYEFKVPSSKAMISIMKSYNNENDIYNFLVRLCLNIKTKPPIDVLAVAYNKAMLQTERVINLYYPPETLKKVKGQAGFMASRL